MGSWKKREGEVAMTHRCSTGYPPYRSSIFFLLYGVVNTLAHISKARLLKEME